MGFWADTYGGREGFDEYGYYIDRNPRYYDDDSDYHSYDDSDPEHERQFDSCDVDDGTIDYLPFWRAVRLAAGEDLPSIAMPRERQVLLGCSRIMDIYPNSMPTSSHVRDPKTDAIAVEIEANPTEFVVITMVAILRELTPELAALRELRVGRLPLSLNNRHRAQKLLRLSALLCKQPMGAVQRWSRPWDMRCSRWPAATLAGAE